MLDLQNLKKIHFIGIGGIGVSAIARMMLSLNKEVTGSDQSGSLVTDELAKLGAHIFIGHEANNISRELDLVVYTIAIPENNPELKEARTLGLPLMTYPEMIGELSSQKKTIAISGTHGKTTTTAMVAQILLEAKLDPTVIVGSILKNWQSNFIAGKGDYFVVEACEYRRSFLNLTPHILAITNIEADHLDYYQDLADIQNAFSELANKIADNGYLICDPKEAVLQPILSTIKAKIIDYTLESLADISLKVPGQHNLANAQVAISIATILGIERGIIKQALENFAGTWRRFEYRGKTKTGALVYDDYAHHPTEIKATLEAGKTLDHDRLVVVFQPHLYSRTKSLFNEFADAFNLADEVIITPIYGARETFNSSITSESLAQAITQKGVRARALSIDESLEYLNQTLTEKDLLLVLGAGDIVVLSQKLVV